MLLKLIKYCDIIINNTIIRAPLFFGNRVTYTLLNISMQRASLYFDLSIGVEYTRWEIVHTMLTG